MNRIHEYSSYGERVVVAAFGVISGGLFALECLPLSLLVAGNYLRSYQPEFAVTNEEQELLGLAWETYKVGPWLPLLLLLLVLLPPTAFARCKWMVTGLYISQFVAARAFSFLWHHFDYHHDNMLSVSSFAEIRQEMTTLERWTYSPLIAMLERGWGYWAVTLHSLVLGAFWTLVIYGLYRLVRRLVLHWRSAKDAPGADSA